MTRTEHTLTVRGEHRRYVLDAPVTGADGLIVALHGGGGDPERMMAMARFHEYTEAARIAVVYPEGVDGMWNDGVPRTTEAPVSGADDFGFLSALVDELGHHLGLTGRAVAVSGMSNGGHLAVRAAIELSSRIGMLANVASTAMPEWLGGPTTDAVDVAHYHGLGDPVRYSTGGGLFGGETVDVDTFTRWWAHNNGCSHDSETEVPDHNGDGTTATVVEHRDGRHGTSVVSTRIHGAGHTWPGGPQLVSAELVGSTTTNIDASAEIVARLRRVLDRQRR